MKSYIASLATLILVALVLLLPGQTLRQVPPEYAATVAIFSGPDSEHTEFDCTATVTYTDGTHNIALTAAHCVEPVMEVARELDSPHVPAKVLAKGTPGADDDIAVISFDLPGMVAIPVGNEDDMIPGDPVTNVSFSEGLPKQFIHGFVTRIHMKTPNKKLTNMIALDIYGNPGCSGSAIIFNGHIVGIMTILHQPTIGGMPYGRSLNLAVPISKLRTIWNAFTGGSEEKVPSLEFSSPWERQPSPPSTNSPQPMQRPSRPYMPLW